MPFSEADVAALKNRIEGEIKRRGLLYHAVGHGWTCEPFGIPGNSWDKREYTVPEDAKALLAEVNGKRELWGGIPLNTNLCYSNPEVVERMSGAIADYCERNPQIDYLHVWLADGKNNHCECESCRRARPSDLYVRLLNEIDRKLTERGLPARIVFLIYVDLLWAPETERLHNPDRFTLMFAPITRTYTTPFCDSLTGELPAAPPYERNRLTMPRDVASNVAHLRDWQRSFPGDGFDFDYHLMWDHFRDLGAFGTAKVLFEDMQNLDRLGLGGMMSCQLQRCFFPNGLMMRAMAEALRDKNASFDAMADAYMRECYGADAPAVSAYLRRLTRLSDAVYLRQEKPAADPEAAAGYAEIPAAVSEMHGLIEERCRTAHSRAERVNWELLRIHGEYCVRIAAAFEARANGEPERARQLYERTVDFLRRTEPEYHPAFDLGLFQSVIKPLFP